MIPGILVTSRLDNQSLQKGESSVNTSWVQRFNDLNSSWPVLTPEEKRKLRDGLLDGQKLDGEEFIWLDGPWSKCDLEPIRFGEGNILRRACLIMLADLCHYLDTNRFNNFALVHTFFYDLTIHRTGTGRVLPDFFSDDELHLLVSAIRHAIKRKTSLEILNDNFGTCDIPSEWKYMLRQALKILIDTKPLASADRIKFTD